MNQLKSDTFRIIPRLDIKDNYLVKGINLEGLRKLGNPNNFANFYSNCLADEIFFQDIFATLYKKNIIGSLISELTKNIFLPLIVGGGVQSINDIETLLKYGADKISINSYAISNPDFLSNAVNIFGSSTICSNIEVNKINSKYFLTYNSGREISDIDVFDWIQLVQDKGIGEIFLTFVHKEGLYKGTDMQFINSLKNKIHVPLVVHGGIGDFDEIQELANIDYVSGISAASIFHYNYLFENSSQNKFELNSEFLVNFKEFNITSIKNKLVINKSSRV